MDRDQAYKLLGIERGTTERDVRRAYRALLFDLEDNGQSDPAFPEKKANLEEAFAICLAEAGKAKDAEAKPVEAAPVDPAAGRMKKILQFGFGIVLVFGLVRGYSWLKDKIVDWGGESPAKTAQSIAALETTGKGSKLVLIKPDGTQVDCPGSADGVIDRDIAWRIDGNRLLFISNRGDGNFNIYRWNPDEKKSVDKRSPTNRAKSGLWFGWDDRPEARNFGLMTSGGFVLQYDQRTGQTEQLLPPPTRKAQGQSGDEQGSVGQIDALYAKIGESFRTAKWGAGRKVLWTVMRREGDEVFVFNPLDTSVNNGKPVPLFAGKNIEFDVTPRGDAIVAVRYLAFADPSQVSPEMMKDGKPVLPFNHVVFFCPANGSTPVPMVYGIGAQMFSGQGKEAVAKLQRGSFTFAQPVVSPDGTMVAFVVAATRGESGFEGQSVVLFPLTQGSKISTPIQAVVGPVSEPSWGPNNDKLTYLMENPDGTHSVYIADFASRSTKRVTTKGDYASPHFSPQK